MALKIRIHERNGNVCEDNGKMVDGEEPGKYYFSAYLYGTQDGNPYMATQVITDYYADTLDEITPYLKSRKAELCKEYGFDPDSELIANWHFGKFHTPTTTPEDSYYDREGEIKV